ncbi:MAG: ferredoxin [Sulfolobales archaeon]|nr:ferredoxin [Sulfolobales archaeon]MDW8010488.1 ferredoxin [Sulfolobales archaeon]
MFNLARYRVVVDRATCISCGVAPAICPEVFELGLDNQKTRVIDKYTVEISESVSIGEVPEELYECVAKAAEACPVAAIRVERVG